MVYFLETNKSGYDCKDNKELKSTKSNSPPLVDLEGGWQIEYWFKFITIILQRGFKLFYV